MDISTIATMRAAVDRAAGARFADRTEQRDKKLAAVDQQGILAAAGIGSAVRRALQLTPAEGRAALVPIAGVEACPAPAPLADTSEAVVAPGGMDRMLESIVGFNDCDQINFLEHGMRAGRSVCRLVYQGQPIGSGFLVAPGIVITNHHVIPDAGAAAGFVAEFDYQLDADDQPLTVKRFALDPGGTFITSDVDAFDFSFVAVQPIGLKGEALAEFGWLPLNPATDKILEGEPVVIIQHPQGREKQICLFHSEMVDRKDQYLYYSTDTEPGSSGAAAFNRQWQLVALHHASAPSGVVKRGKNIVANEGIRISAILQSLQAADRVTGGDSKALYTRLTDPATQSNGRPQAAIAVSGTAPASEIGEPEAKTLIRPRPQGWFDTPPRPGYADDFLGADAVVPLPTLPEALARDIATLADGSSVLNYMHYSVVMSASRRLAYFSAANIDGKTVRRVERTDRDPDHPMPIKPHKGDLEAADTWWFDNRIPVAAQVGAEIYDGSDFDYGHLTRRLDPVWGDARTLRIANDDTFHMTNCTPQAHQLNTVTWAHLEDAVLDAATNNKMRFTVITGPVLDPRDPSIRGVQCPTAYWKVIAYRGDAGLVAMGFLQWQTDLVAQIEKDLESLKELDRAEEWHVPISDIARLTALDFGPLLDADVRKAAVPGEPLTESLVDRLVPARRG